MKIPEPLFAIINPVVRTLLRSPLHFLASASLMIIAFKGRKTGRLYATPVRYLMEGDFVLCFSSKETRWWRNLRGGATATPKLRGRRVECRAEVVEGEPAIIREALAGYLARFPQDAAYHNVRLNPDRTPIPEDLERAAANSVQVCLAPV